MIPFSPVDSGGVAYYTNSDSRPYWRQGAVPSVWSEAEQERASWQWGDIIDQLLAIRGLEDDWDGEGSVAPHPGLVDGAIKLAQSLKAINGLPPNRVHASVNGTVYFEWYSPEGYAEIEVILPSAAEYRVVRKDSKEAEVHCFGFV